MKKDRHTRRKAGARGLCAAAQDLSVSLCTAQGEGLPSLWPQPQVVNIQEKAAISIG